MLCNNFIKLILFTPFYKIILSKEIYLPLQNEILASENYIIDHVNYVIFLKKIFR
jgi:hypothetical protein